MLHPRREILRLLLAIATLLSARGVTAQEFVRIEPELRPTKDEITGLMLPVRIDPFWIARHELTQEEFARVMGRNPSKFQDDAHPVENVTWREATEYCNRRSHREGLSLCYEENGQRIRACTGYRLPTEAEWLAAAGVDTEGRFPEELLAGAALYDAGTRVSQLRERAVAGTRATPKGEFEGIADLAGNVWEWCEDRFNVQRVVESVKNPSGPQTGHERVLRGGSYLTRAREWNKGLRSSMPSDARSPYVGFRIAKSVAAEATGWDSADTPSIVAITSLEVARAARTDLLKKRWLDVLGQPQSQSIPVRARVVDEYTEPAWSARLLEFTLEPGMPWRGLLVLPAHRKAERLPCLVIPYYDVDTPLGKNLGGRNALPPGVRSFAHLAAVYGMAAVVVRWSGENDSPGYYEMVADLAQRHPGVTGLGYWVWQAQRLAGWLEEQPEIDPARIGIMGHSLGGKMALYAAAFAPRYRAVVSSEPGIAFEFSNYGDPWYFGERLTLLPEGTDQDELIELIAPRPFLLIAGESADGEKSVPILQRAAPVYASAGKPQDLAILNHGKGHSPTPESVVAIMEWLASHLTR